MLELGGMVASAVLKVVTKQIGSTIAGEIKLQGAFKKNLTKMKMTLEWRHYSRTPKDGPSRMPQSACG